MGTGGGQARPLRFQAQDVVGGDGTVEALQRQLADGLGLDQLFNLRVDTLTNEDLPIPGIVAQASGEVGDCADHPVLPSSLEADGAHGGVAMCNSDPEAQLNALFAPRASKD